MAHVTISEVAAKAGVSTATVSRVMNGVGNVNPELKQRVLRAVQRLDYHPNPTGRALRQQRTRIVSALMPDIKNPFFTEFTYALESALYGHQLHVSIGNTDESYEIERNYVASSIEQRSAGVVLAVVSDRSESPWQILDSGTPLVLIDRTVEDYEGWSVTVDNEEVGAIAARHLCEQGFRHPAVLTGSEKISSTRDRCRSFMRTAGELGMAVGNDHIVRTDTREQGAEDAVWKLLASSMIFDSIFATNGPLTSAAFRVLHEAGWTNQKAIGLIGVDDEFWTSLVTPGVTVIRQPVAEIGRISAQLIMDQIKGDGELVPAQVMLAPHLVPRGSTMFMTSGRGIAE